MYLVSDVWDVSASTRRDLYGNLSSGTTLTGTDWRTPSQSTISQSRQWTQPVASAGIPPPGYWGGLAQNKGFGSHFTGLNLDAVQSPYLIQTVQKQTTNDDLQTVDMDVSDEEDGNTTKGAKWTSNPVRILLFVVSDGT